MATSVSDFLPETDRKGQRIIRPKLHHWGIATTRNEEMENWYRDVLGYEVVARPGSPLRTMTFVSNDLNHHGGSYLSPPTVSDDPERLFHTRIQHLAWEYEDIDQMLESWQRIRNLGIEPVSCWCHSVSWSFYYKDPDLNTVELNTQAFATLEEGLEYALTDRWAENANGFQVDPEKLIAARKEGVGLDELRERSINKEYEPEELVDPLSGW
jgi:catechol 2,3-dioxygenase